MRAVGIGPLIFWRLWKIDVAHDLVLQLTKIATRAARDLVLTGHSDIIMSAVQEDHRWIHGMLGDKWLGVTDIVIVIVIVIHRRYS